MPELFVCEIINPSDPYTLLADDFTLGAVAVAILGGGRMGLEGGGNRSPVLFGWQEWFAENGINDLGEYIVANRSRLADVLDSVLIGDRKERADAEAMLAMLSGEDRAKWLAGRHDRRRSSMNDIGGRARGLASKFREQELKESARP